MSQEQQEQPQPETVKQQTVKAQYAGFEDYLIRDLPESENRQEALAKLRESQAAAYLAAQES